MSSWVLGQIDYLFFIYGLAFILLGAVSYFLAKDARQRLPWLWLALFGFTHGVHEWLDLLPQVWHGALWFATCRWLSLALSFLFLVEFGRLSLVRQWGRGPGRWILGLLALLGCLGAGSGWTGLGATTRYALGFAGSLSAGLGLFGEARRQGLPGRIWIRLAGAAFILYALAAGLIVPPAPFFPASILNFQTFLRLTGLPVVLPRTFLAALLIITGLGYLRASWQEEFPQSRRHRTRYLYGMGAALLVILTAGWLLTNFLGNLGQKQAQKETLGHGKLIIQRLTFELEEAEAAVRAMSGSPSLGPALWAKSPQTLAQAESVLDRYQMRFGASPAYILDHTGACIASSNREDRDSFVGHNYGYRPYFQDALKGLPGRYFAVGATSKKPGFFAAHPVHDPVGNIVGIAAIKNTLELFQQQLKESDPAFLIDPDGVILLSSRPNHDSQSLWPVRAFNEAEKSQFAVDQPKAVFPRFLVDGAEIEIAGTTYLFYRQYLDTMAAPGWSLVLLAPNKLVVFFRLLGIAATFIVVLFTLLAAGSNLFIREGANRIVASEARFRAMFDAAPEAVFVFDAATRKIVDANPFMAHWLGYSPEELLDLEIDQLLAPESAGVKGSKALQPLASLCYQRKDGSLVDVECTTAGINHGGQARQLAFVRDITERRRAERDLRASLRFLEIVHRHTEIRPLLEAFVAEIQAYTGCEAVGIRVLDAAGAIPYMAYQGFSKLFYERENPLSTKSDQCMCINVIKGKVNPALSFYSEGGSIFMNGTSRFLATVSDRDKGKTRNVCNQEGYESVALIPFRRGEEVLGLIHVADKRENMVPLHLVEMLEQAGMQLGTAFMKLQAEAALRDSEQFLTDIFNSIPDVLTVLDQDLNIIQGNKAFDNLPFKLPTAGSKCYEVFHGRSEPCEVCIARQVFQTGQTAEKVLTIPRGDGSFEFIEIHAFPMLNRTTGEVQRVIEYGRNITERRRAEEALASEAIRRRLLFEQSKDGIVVLDQNGKVYEANHQFAEMLGYSPGEVQQLHIWDWEAQWSREQLLEMFPRLGLVDESFETVHRRKDGTVFDVEVSANWVTLSGHTLGFCICRDISPRKKAEAERLRFSKLESVATLAGGIAHDFNNILTAIMGNISLAMLDQPAKGLGRESLSAAERACLQAQAMARQLLTFAKGGAPIKELICLEKLINEAASFAASGSQVRCEFSFPDNLWAAEADPGQISQVFQNLVINAIQAMAAGGTIQVRGENLEVGEGSVLPLEAGGYVKISVQDQGIGIPADFLPKIFDPYFTTKQSGSGLGLATVYSIVARHRGHIAVESKLGEGTTFQIYLPAAAEAAVHRPEADQEVLSGKGKILVMDDEPVVRDMLQAMLRHLGYQAILAKDGDEAIRLFTAARTAGEHFAALILDLTVPGGMGGKAAIEILRKVDPQVKAIVSSGYSDDPVMAEFEKYGFRGVITKPYRVAELSRVLQQALNRQPGTPS